MSKIKKTVFMLVLIILVLVLVEGGVRVMRFLVTRHEISKMERLAKTNLRYNTFDLYRDKREAEDAKRVFESYDRMRSAYRPYVERKLIPLQKYPGININGWGYRGPEFDFEKKKDTLRVFVFGGSFVWGTGATDDDHTLPGYLQQMVRKRTGKTTVEIINAGEPGYCQTQELILLFDEVLFFRPDVVIFIDGFNECYSPFQGLPAGYPNHFFEFNQLLAKSYKPPAEKTIEGQMEFLKNQAVEQLLTIRGSALWKTLSEKVKSIALQQDVVQQLTLRYIHNAKLARSICDQGSIKFVAALQPCIFLGKELTPQEQSVLQYWNRRFPGLDSYYRAIYPRFREQVKDGIKKENILFLDLVDVLAGEKASLYSDFVHLTNEGYSRIAARVDEFLVRNQLLPGE
jgi:lysophospholipase L1-like esterase